MIRRAAVVPVRLEGLRSIQRTVCRTRLVAHARRRELAGVDHGKAGLPRDTPVVMKLGAKRWLIDGTHRASVAVWNGAWTVNARLVDLDALMEGR